MVPQLSPENIYNESFNYIRNTLKLDRSLKSDIIVRSIHATADFDIGKSLVFSHNFESAISYFNNEIPIITDINMVKSGITSYKNIKCYITDSEIKNKSKETGISRSYLAMKKACLLNPNGIFVVGDAPTALFAIIDSIKDGICNPAFITAVPVGFVSALESKSKLIAWNGNYITNISRKGGSAVACAIINAIIRYKNVH